MMNIYWVGGEDSDPTKLVNYSIFPSPNLPVPQEYSYERYRIRIVSPVTENEFPPPSAILEYDVSEIAVYDDQDTLVWSQSYDPGEFLLVENEWKILDDAPFNMDLARVELQSYSGNAPRVQLEGTTDSSAQEVEWDTIYDYQVGESHSGNRTISLDHVNFLHDIRFDYTATAQNQTFGTGSFVPLRAGSIHSTGFTGTYAFPDKVVLLGDFTILSGAVSPVDSREFYCAVWLTAVAFDAASEWLASFLRGTHTSGFIANSRAIREDGWIDGGSDAGSNTRWNVVTDLWWNNREVDNDGSNRENYTYDQAGLYPAISAEDRQDTSGDNLRFDGSGFRAGDDWTLSPGATLECASIRFGMFPGVATSDPTAEVTTGWVQIGEDTADSPGTYTALSGTWNLTAIRSDDTGEPGTAGKTLTTFYTSHRQTIGNETDPLDLNILDGGIIRIRAEASPEIYADISSPGTIVVDPDEGSNRTYSLRGSITADEVHANSTGNATLRLLPANQVEVFAANTSLQTLRISNTARVSLTFPEYDPTFEDGGQDSLRGLSKNGTPDSWTDIIMEDQAELRLATQPNAASKGSLFANSVTVADGAQAFIRWAAHRGSFHQVNLGGHYTIGLNATLTLQRTAGSRGVIDIVGSKSYADYDGDTPFAAAAGTLPPDAGLWDGPGSLRIRGATTAAQYYRWYPVFGGLLSITGDVVFDGDATANAAAQAGYVWRGQSSNMTLGFGGGKIVMNGEGCQFLCAIHGTYTNTITNDVEINQQSSNESAERVPVVGFRRTFANPTMIFSGDFTINAFRWALGGRRAGSSTVNRITGHVNILGPGTISRLLTSGDRAWSFDGGVTVASGTEFQIGALLDGSFGPNIDDFEITGLPCSVILNSVVTAESLRVIGSSASNSNISAEIASAQAIKNVGTLIVDDAVRRARLRIRQPGTEMDGILVMRPNSRIRGDSGASLVLNSAGPHEWSAGFDADRTAECRNLTVVTTTDGTTINYDSSDTLNSIPLLRAEADTTLDTTTGAVRVIRPGQSLAGDLPAGFTSAQLERGKTLTVGEDIRLSLYRTDGQPLGTTGLATISGDGVLIFSQNNGWSPPSFYDLAEFDILTSFAPAENGAVLSVAGFAGLRDVRVESSSSDLTVNFTDTSVGGDFYAFTNIAGGTGDVAVRWAGVNNIAGDYYQRQPQSLPVADAMHRTEFLGASTTTIVGDFRPGSDKSGGTGGVSNPRSMDIFAGEDAEITVRGTPFFRNAFHTASYIFQPLDPNGYATPAKFIIDPLAAETLMSFDYGGVVADMEVRNSAGGARTLGLDTTGLWVNTLTVSGDNLTIDLNTSTSEAYLGGLVCTGAGVELRLPNYMEVYTFNWEFSNVPPEAVFDLRGFATVVEGPGDPTIALIPDGTTDLWFDNNPLLLTRVEYDLTFTGGQPIIHHDSTALRQMVVTGGNGRTIEVRDDITVGDLFRDSGTTVPGVTIDVQAPAVLTVTGQLSFRPVGSNNTTFDLAVAGTLRYSPRGDPADRILNFGTAANPLPDRLEILLEDGFAPTDPPPIYVVGIATYVYEFNQVLLRNQSDTTDLHIAIAETTRVKELTSEVAGLASLTLDFNGQTLEAQTVILDSQMQLQLTAGSELGMVSFDSNIATIDAPGVDLPDVYHRSLVGLSFLSDITAAAYFQSMDNVGPLFTNGNDLTVDGSIALVEGSVDLATLPGTRFTGASFQVAGIPMDPSGTWFVDTTVSAPVASFTTLANSDASGSILRGEATVQVTNDGGNVNWNFGEPPPFLSGLTGLGLIGLGLRFTKG